MKQIRMDLFLVVLQHIFAFSVVLLQVLNLEDLVSPCFYATLLVTVVLWLVLVCIDFTWTDWLCLAVLGLALVHITIGVVADPQGLSFAYLKKYFLFSGAVLYFQTASKIEVPAWVQKFLLCGIDLLAVFLTIMYGIQSVEMYTYQGVVSGYLTFRFSNPNLASLFLCCFFMLEISRLFENGKWWKKLFHGGLAVIQFCFILGTKSRNTLLIAVFYAVICLLLGIFKPQRTRFSRVSAVLAAVSPMLFAVLYLWLIQKSWVQVLLSSLRGEGKNLFSRVEIWNGAFEEFRASPVIGAYGNVMRHMEHFQMHNTHLDILVSYGTGVFILFCALLYWLIRGTEAGCRNRMDDIRTFGFVCAVALGIGEAAVFSGGLSIYIFVGLFLLLRGGTEASQAICEKALQAEDPMQEKIGDEKHT